MFEKLDRFYSEEDKRKMQREKDIRILFNCRIGSKRYYEVLKWYLEKYPEEKSKYNIPEDI